VSPVPGGLGVLRSLPQDLGGTGQGGAGRAWTWRIWRWRGWWGQTGHVGAGEMQQAGQAGSVSPGGDTGRL